MLELAELRQPSTVSSIDDSSAGENRRHAACSEGEGEGECLMGAWVSLARLEA